MAKFRYFQSKWMKWVNRKNQLCLTKLFMNLNFDDFLEFLPFLIATSYGVSPALFLAFILAPLSFRNRTMFSKPAIRFQWLSIPFLASSDHHWESPKNFGPKYKKNNTFAGGHNQWCCSNHILQFNIGSIFNQKLHNTFAT